MFLLIFGPAEKAMGSWRVLLLFLLGGAVANPAAVRCCCPPRARDHWRQRRDLRADRLHLALFRAPGRCCRWGCSSSSCAPASLLIGILGAAAGGVRLHRPRVRHGRWAHVAGFLFGVAYALLVRAVERGCAGRRFLSRVRVRGRGQGMSRSRRDSLIPYNPACASRCTR